MTAAVIAAAPQDEPGLAPGVARVGALPALGDATQGRGSPSQDGGAAGGDGGGE